MTKLVEGLKINSIKLEKPFRLIVGGGSGSGKSFFVQKLIEENHFQSSFEQIKYIYPDYLDECPTEFDTECHVECIPGLPDKRTLSLIETNSLVIIDDLMLEVSKCEDIARLFTVIARKKNISVILIVQNVYQQGKQFRNIRLSATGIVLFKFYAGIDSNYRILRDVGLASYISKKTVEEIYSTRYRYIYLDLHPNRQSDFIAIRTNIFEKYPIFYYNMEYVAIPKADFIKYFKIIESKKGKIKAIKNAITIKKGEKSKRKPEEKRKREEVESKRRRESNSEKSESETESVYSETDESD